MLDDFETPIVLAPLAGGPSTPELTAAAANAGAFAFLAAGYLSAAALRDRMAATRTLTARPFGVNVFVPGRPSDPKVVAAYAAVLAGEAERLGAALGDPRFDDDDWDAKVALLTEDPVAVVSFTFGCPPVDVIEHVHRAGSEVWITVTTPDEAAAATAASADVVVAQGSEAGGPRSTWDDADNAIDVLSLIEVIEGVPVVAAGGIATGAAIAAVLAAGARAAAVGTAFLRCPEAGTSDVHRAALKGTAPTALTRAFTGRTARGIRNRFLDEYSDRAPSAYPEIHHLTAPLRQAGRQQGIGDVVNLWAGEAYQLACDLPAGGVVRKLMTELASADS